MIAAKPQRQRVHLGLRLRQRDGRLQLRDDVVVLAIPDGGRIGRERQVRHDLRMFDDAKGWHHLAGHVESRRKHSDDLDRKAVEDDRAADHPGVATVAPLPGAKAQNGDARRTFDVITRHQQPAHQRLRAQHRQEVRRHANRAHAFRFPAIAGEVQVGANRDRDLLERHAAGLDVEILSGGKPVLGDPQPGRAVPENDEPFVVGVGERAQQQRAGDAENRAVGADADRQGHDGRQCEAGRTAKRAKRVAEVLHACNV